MSIIKDPSELSTTNRFSINTKPIQMTLRNFNDWCKELLRTDVHYVNKDLNINLQDYYHTTSWMINKLSLIKILGDYIPIPGKDAQGYTTDNWQNLALSYASNVFNKTSNIYNIINLKDMEIQSGPYVGMTFGIFDSICKAYAPTFVDELKKMGWIATYTSVPTIAPEALGDLEGFFKAYIGMIDSMPMLQDLPINAPYWLHY